MGVLLYYAVVRLESLSPGLILLWSCSQCPFWGLPLPWSWHTRRNLTLHGTLGCAFALLTPFETETLDYCSALNPTLRWPCHFSRLCFYIYKMGRKPQTGWRWQSLEALLIQRFRGSCRSARPLVHLPWSRCLTQAQNVFLPQGLACGHPAHLGPPRRKRAPNRERAAGAPLRECGGSRSFPRGLRAAIQCLGSRLCERGDPGAGGPEHRVAPGMCDHAPAAAVAWAPVARGAVTTDARRALGSQAQALRALRCHGRPEGAVDARPLVHRFRHHRPPALRGAAEPQRRRGWGPYPALPQPEQRRGGRFDSLLLPQGGARGGGGGGGGGDRWALRPPSRGAPPARFPPHAREECRPPAHPLLLASSAVGKCLWSPTVQA